MNLKQQKYLSFLTQATLVVKELHDLSSMAFIEDTDVFILLQETQLTRETAHVSEESQASNLATTESKGSTDTSKNKESEASEVPQDVMLQKSISEDNESGDSVPHNTVQVNEEKIDSGKNTVPKTEQSNKDLNQIELNHENCSGQNDPDQKETAVSTDEIGQEITPEATQNYESSTESCKADKEENVIIANGNLEKPLESSTAGSPSHKTDTIAAPLEDKSVQTPIVDPNTNKKIKKKDKSTAEEKKLGNYEYTYIFLF